MSTFFSCGLVRAVRRLAALGALAVGVTLVPAQVAPAQGPPLVVTTTSLQPVEVGEPLAIQLDASGGTTPYQWVPDSLPAGVTITSGGLLGGAATASGAQGVEVSVVDAENQRTTVTLTLAVSPGPAITTSGAPQGQVGEDYSLQLGATNGTAPFTWSIAKGGIPGGLVLSSSGLLSGRPGTTGTSTLDVEVTDAVGASTQANLTVEVLPPPLPAEGYVTVDAAGHADAVGTSATPSRGRPGGKTVGVAVVQSGAGYWTVNSAGRVHAYGAARYSGSVARRDLEGSAVGVAAPPAGTGYWVASSNGHVYGFGAVRSFGSVSKHVRHPRIVGIASTSDGGGYWLVSAAGHVYAFGDAPHLGSVPPRALSGRVMAIAAATTDRGYLVVSSTGRVYGFGGAHPLPAVAGRATGTVVGVAVPPAAAGAGYWLLTRSGAVFGFGQAREVATTPPQPISNLTSAVPATGIAGGA